MQIECVFFGPLREAVGEKTVHRETDAETTGELLAEIQAAYPELPQLTDADELADGITVAHNGKYLQHRDGLDTELGDGDVVRLTPPVTGG